MKEAILHFPEQFSFRAKIENKNNFFRKNKKYIIGGMGGSALPAEIFSSYYKDYEILVHRDYGIPEMSKKNLQEYGFIAISYSGNTEETIDFFEEARKRHLPLAVISTGGKLLELAEKYKLPFVRLPQTKIQPRMALGYVLLGLVEIIGEKKGVSELQDLSRILQPKKYLRDGKKIADFFENHIPIIYSSLQNKIIAYNWKIKLNETGKIPAFYNIFSELNHNEMTGFDRMATTKALSEKFRFLFLEDAEDCSRIQKRMVITKKLFAQRGLKIFSLKIQGISRWQRIFQSFLVADWTALFLAEKYGVESEQVPMVEEFKKLMR